MRGDQQIVFLAHELEEGISLSNSTYISMTKNKKKIEEEEDVEL